MKYNPQILAGKLDTFNGSEFSYNVLSELFTPFSNNLGSSHMELYAYAIESVYNEIQKFKPTKKLDPEVIHIPGLNDSDAFGLSCRLSGVNTVRDNLMATIGFAEDDILTLKSMLLQVEKNKVALMEKDMGAES